MNDEEFLELIRKLKSASEEIWAAKIVMRELETKYATLCVQILVEGRQIPKLINNRIENRKRETGWDPVHPDFWDVDMIIALSDHFEELLSREGSDATT